MLNLLYVESLVAVLATGSFRAAAKRLGRPQPTVSQQIQKLEADLGAKLISRNAAGCTPTREGTIFLPYAQALLRTVDRAAEAMRGGRIAIGASGNIGTYMLQPVVGRFAAQGHPLPVVTIAPNPAVADMLFRGEIDLAAMEWWDGRPGFTAIRWRSEELVVIVPPDHLWAGQESVPAEELARHPMIGGEPGSGTGRILIQALANAGGDFSVSLMLGSTEAVKNAVQAGLGISVVLASAVAREAAAGLLHLVRVQGAELRKDLFAVHAADLPAASAVHDFTRLLAMA